MGIQSITYQYAPQQLNPRSTLGKKWGVRVHPSPPRGNAPDYSALAGERFGLSAAYQSGGGSVGQRLSGQVSLTFDLQVEAEWNIGNDEVNQPTDSEHRVLQRRHRRHHGQYQRQQHDDDNDDNNNNNNKSQSNLGRAPSPPLTAENNYATQSPLVTMGRTKFTPKTGPFPWAISSPI